jgi:hypothetical protein
MEIAGNFNLRTKEGRQKADNMAFIDFAYRGNIGIDLPNTKLPIRLVKRFEKPADGFFRISEIMDDNNTRVSGLSVCFYDDKGDVADIYEISVGLDSQESDYIERQRSDKK